MASTTHLLPALNACPPSPGKQTQSHCIKQCVPTFPGNSLRVMLVAATAASESAALTQTQSHGINYTLTMKSVPKTIASSNACPTAHLPRELVNI